VLNNNNKKTDKYNVTNFYNDPVGRNVKISKSNMINIENMAGAVMAAGTVKRKDNNKNFTRRVV